jgi:hypothetical protein
MKNLKHSKFKNTGVLFELLVRQVASDTLNNNDSKAIPLIKKHFSKSTELAKEFNLYQTLVKERFSKEEKASHLIEAVMSARSAINQTILNRQKYNLIKEIKSNYNLEDFFKSKVNNYKTLAAIYKLFEFAEADDPKEYVETKFALLEHVRTVANKTEATKPMLESENKDVRILASKIIVDRFNEKYSSQLTTEQKSLLRQYINTVSNSTSLKDYVIKEAKSISEQLKTLKTTITSKVLRIKLNEVSNLLSSLSKKHVIEDKDVLTMLRYYELVSELNKVKGK